MKKSLFELKILILFLLKQILSLWRKPLDRSETVRLIAKNIVYQNQNSQLPINTYKSPIQNETQLRLNVLKSIPNSDDTIVNFEPDYVWQLHRGRDWFDLQICRSGHVKIDKKFILDLDYGTVGALKEFFIKSKVYNCELAIAPWSHNFGGYYTFLLSILTKLCRIEAAFGRDIWQKAKIFYPLLHTSYEKQYLDKLGVPPEAIVDTRQANLVIQPQTLIVANNQTNINRISPLDILLLRQKFLGKQQDRVNNRKIFLPRRGRRVLKNEAAIRDILIQYDFEIIEDIERTVEEQIELFNSASVIVGVHGAGLANLIWCQPKTKVVELFYNGYTKPGFYYLTKVLNLKYDCIFDNSETIEHFSNQYCDLEIEPKLLRNMLDKILI